MAGIEKELNCKGYWGFGGGHLIGQAGRPKQNQPLYCGQCPLSQECWDAHRARVSMLIPGMTIAFDRIAKKHEGNPDAMMEEWFKLSEGAPDPYTVVMGGNVEDGIAVGSGGEPKKRGEGTLRFPFVES